MNKIKLALEKINEKLIQKISIMCLIKIFIIVIIIMAIFQAGIFVGYHKAMFYKSAGTNYYRQDRFGSKFEDKKGMEKRDRQNPTDRFGKFMTEIDVPGGHGAVGKIVSINLPTIIVASPDNIEKTITISDETIIRQFRENIKSDQLQVGEIIAVVGEISSSDDGLIKAKLIRILPPPPENYSEKKHTNTIAN